MSDQLTDAKIRFGAFELSPASGELRKHGIRIKLPEQSFNILLALLESPQLSVSREELRKRLWGENTNVDFDHGLNAAVNRLRDALGDSSGEPNFIETLPKRGYRFIASVEKDSAPVELRVETKRPAWPRWWMAATLLLLLALVASGVIWQQSRVPLPPPKVHVLTSYPHSEIQPSFSPDGKQVAFVWSGPNNNNHEPVCEIRRR